jgi:hypothetical protein
MIMDRGGVRSKSGRGVNRFKPLISVSIPDKLFFLSQKGSSF